MTVAPALALTLFSAAAAMPTRGYLSQVERTLTFGLGEAARIERLVVHWTDGTIQELTGTQADREIRLKKPPPP
jgi:hypothetical protein